MEHTIDVANQSLGRVATGIAILLRGKSKPGFAPYKDEGDVVIVKNVSQMRITGRKMDQKTYYRHSGYPGGITGVKLKKIFAERPSVVLRRAVWGMLPLNKLRAKQIKRLKFA